MHVGRRVYATGEPSGRASEHELLYTPRSTLTPSLDLDRRWRWNSWPDALTLGTRWRKL